MTLVYELMPLVAIALGASFLMSKQSRTKPTAARLVRWGLGIYVPPVIGSVTYMLVALQAPGAPDPILPWSPTPIFSGRCRHWSIGRRASSAPSSYARGSLRVSPPLSGGPFSVHERRTEHPICFQLIVPATSQPEIPGVAASAAGHRQDVIEFQP